MCVKYAWCRNFHQNAPVANHGTVLKSNPAAHYLDLRRNIQVLHIHLVLNLLVG